MSSQLAIMPCHLPPSPAVIVSQLAAIMAGEAAWCREDLGIDFWQALALVLGFSALAGAWIQALDRRLAPGFTRWVGTGCVGHAWGALQRLRSHVLIAARL